MWHRSFSGADPGFQVRGGAHLKKLRRAEGGAKIFGVFRVKNHDFTPTNHIFSNFRGGAPAPGFYSCYTSVMSYERGNDRAMITSSGTYPWSFGTKIFRSG